jgi:hypothetical protein
LHLLQQVLKIELKKPNQNSSEENNLKNSTNYAT